MLNYGIITAFSRELLLNCSCWSMDYHSIITWTLPEWMTHFGLRNHHNIVTWIPAEWMAHVGLFIHRRKLTQPPPERLMLDYGIITAFSRKLVPNKSCCSLESSIHSHLSSSWISNVGIRNHQNIFTWTPPERMAHTDYAIFCLELFLDGSFWKI
jgi:hypothetical protein